MKNLKFITQKLLLLLFAFCLLPYLCFAQTLAPGEPGKDAQRANVVKQGVGASTNIEKRSVTTTGKYSKVPYYVRLT